MEADLSGYMTTAISVSPPRPFDLKLTNELEEALKPLGCFESPQELSHRFETLKKLDALFKTWLRDISFRKRMPEAVVKGNVNGKIYTFGSYRLGVYSRDADINLLCVAPKHIHRGDFFSSFIDHLRSLPQVSDVRANEEEEAYVPCPCVKMKFDNIEICMVFARLGQNEVPDDLELMDDNILKNLDPKCIRSLNGHRDTDEILRLIRNHDSFRLALRCVKAWAKKAGIYSNALGYLFGANLAILVARTCQLYPNAAASTIVLKFFLVFSKWKWPQPVLLRPMKTNNFLQLPVWDSRANIKDRRDLMPIITPAYAYQNSAYLTSSSTRTVMQDAFNRGLKICENILAGRATRGNLFDPPNFFHQYKHFILLVASSNSRSDQLQWNGMLNSKMRLLIATLEKNPFIALPHIWPTKIGC